MRMNLENQVGKCHAACTCLVPGPSYSAALDVLHHQHMESTNTRAYDVIHPALWDTIEGLACETTACTYSHKVVFFIVHV